MNAFEAVSEIEDYRDLKAERLDDNTSLKELKP